MKVPGDKDFHQLYLKIEDELIDFSGERIEISLDKIHMVDGLVVQLEADYSMVKDAPRMFSVEDVNEFTLVLVHPPKCEVVITPHNIDRSRVTETSIPELGYINWRLHGWVEKDQLVHWVYK